MATNTNNNTEKTSNGLGLYEQARNKAKQDKENYYTSLTGEIDSSKKKQQEMANISYERLKKYLSNNTSGPIGTSESTLLKAYNNYMNTMSDISSNYNSQKNELERYKQEDLAAIDEKYDEKMEAASFENYNLFEQHVQSLLGKYADENGKLSTSEKDDITKYIDDKKEMLTDEHYERLKTALDGYVASEEEQAAVDTLQIRSDNQGDKLTVSGGIPSAVGYNYEITLGDKTYHVERGPNAALSIVKRLNEAYGGSPKTGSSIVFNDKIYVFDGKDWSLVQKRESSYHDDFSALAIAYDINNYDRGLSNGYQYKEKTKEYLIDNPDVAKYVEDDATLIPAIAYYEDFVEDHPAILKYLKDNPNLTLAEVSSYSEESLKRLLHRHT